MAVNSNQKPKNTTTTNVCYTKDITAFTQMCVNQYVKMQS